MDQYKVNQNNEIYVIKDRSGIIIVVLCPRNSVVGEVPTCSFKILLETWLMKYRKISALLGNFPIRFGLLLILHIFLLSYYFHFLFIPTPSLLILLMANCSRNKASLAWF